MNKTNVLNFYENLLEYNFLPYWSKFVDEKYGGLLNCINNYGDKLICKDKFTWSQGRWLWCLGRIYALKQKGAFSSVSEETLLKWMRGTYDFICNHSIYGDSLCCFLLEQDGTKKLDARTKRYDASIYADSFALIGMSQYAKVLNLKEEFPKIEKLYNMLKETTKIRNNRHPSHAVSVQWDPKFEIDILYKNGEQENIFSTEATGFVCKYPNSVGSSGDKGYRLGKNQNMWDYIFSE